MSTLSVPIHQDDNAQLAFEIPTDHPPASLPVPNSSRSFWIDTPGANPLATEGSQGSLVDDADVCIIGSGITGISAAYHLATTFAEKRPHGKSNVKAVILEAREFCQFILNLMPTLI